MRYVRLKGMCTCVMYALLKAMSAVTHAHVVFYRKSKRQYVLNWTKVGKKQNKKQT